MKIRFWVELEVVCWRGLKEKSCPPISKLFYIEICIVIVLDSLMLGITISREVATKDEDASRKSSATAWEMTSRQFAYIADTLSHLEKALSRLERECDLMKELHASTEVIRWLRIEVSTHQNMI